MVIIPAGYGAAIDIRIKTTVKTSLGRKRRRTTTTTRRRRKTTTTMRRRKMTTTTTGVRSSARWTPIRYLIDV